MIQIVKNGNVAAILFTDSDFYLFNSGQIIVPLNSLSMVVDKSDMATFRKSSNNDLLFSAKISKITMGGTQLTKANAKTLFDSILAGPTGGGFRFVSVEQLPQTGEDGIIYLVPEGEDSFEEYVWLDDENRFEKLGFETDLTGYVNSGNFETYLTDSQAFSMLEQGVSAISASVSANTANISTLSGAMSGKQDTLIAGSGIGINNNVISVTATIPTGDFVTTGDFNSFVENSAVTKNNFDSVLSDSQYFSMLDQAVGLMSGDVTANTANINTLSGQVSANTASIANKQNARLEGVITEDDNIYTINQSFRNLYQTYLSGGDIIAQKGNSDNVYQLSQISNSSMTFSNSDAHEGVIENFNLTSGDVLTREVYDIPTKLQGKQNVLTAGNGISIENDTISVTGGTPTSGYVTTEQLEESELVTSAALNDLNERVETLEQGGGGGGSGLTANIVECTQAEYSAMTGHATDTIYVITDAELAYYTASEVDDELAPINSSISGLSSDINAIEITIGDINEALDAINGDNNS